MGSEQPPRSAAVSLPSPAVANFDRVARLYRWAEYMTMGPMLRRTREHFLPVLLEAQPGLRQALVLGDGDGRFLAALLHHAPHLLSTAVDSSAAMLALLQARCRFAAGRLQTTQAALTALPPQALHPAPDLIVTHFVLDCLTEAEVRQLALTLAQAARPGTLWVVSDFALPPRQPWRALGALLIGGLYRAFRLLTGLGVQRLPEIDRPLAQAGFRRLQRWSTLRGLLFSELWQRGP